MFHNYLVVSRIILTFASRNFYKLKNNIMKTEEIKDLFNKFESIVCDYNGVECWSARELQKLLGYMKWDKFQNVIEKAKNACVNAGEMVDNHFPQVEKLVAIGSGVLYERGVDSKGFAIIRSKGDKDAKTDHNIR